MVLVSGYTLDEPDAPSLQKPFDRQELLAVMNETLAAAPLEKQSRRRRVLLVEDDAQAAVTTRFYSTEDEGAGAGVMASAL